MLLAIVLAYLLGLAVAPACSGGLQLALGVTSLGLASLVVLGGDELTPRYFTAPLAALAFLAGLATPLPPSPPVLARGPVVFVGRVEAELVKRTGRTVVVEVVRSESGERAAGTEASVGRRDGTPVVLPRGTRVRLPEASAAVGAEIEVRGEFVPSVPYRNASPHPPWPDARPTVGLVPASAERRLTMRHIDRFSGILAHGRGATRRALDATLTPRVAGVAAALVLGDGALLDETDANSIRNAGLTHVLAVSGTHIAMVGGAFVFALERWLRRFAWVLEPRRVAAALGIPFAILHALFAGAVPSGMRAAVTASVAWALVAGNRRPDALATTAFASFLLALPEPAGATRPGFLLSVLATVAVVTAEPPRDGSLRASVRAAAELAVRCALATAPLVIHTFGDVPLASLLANLLLVPLGSIALLPLSLVHAAVALVSPIAASASAAVFEPCARAFLEGCDAFGRMDDGVALPPTTGIEALLLVAFTAFATTASRWRRSGMALVIVLYASEELRVRAAPDLRGRFVIEQLDIGQGDAALVRFPDGGAALVDFGPSRPDVGARVLVPHLRAHRIDRLAFAILTHRHPDHYGGLATLASSIDVPLLFEPGETEDEDRGGEASVVIGRLRRGGTRVLGPRELCGRPRSYAGVRVEVLAPCPAAPRDFSLNDGSLVVRFSFGEHRFLWVGDAERAAEDRMLASVTPAALRATVLKVGHHGSRTSTSERFLRAVAPRYAIVSSGAGNRFDHPHGETLDTLRRAGVRLFRTDVSGGVVFATDGRRLEVRPTVR